MILNISGRTNIVAFYTEWLINRLEEGFVDVRNPYNHQLVSRIYFKDVDAYVFCTKNPLPIINHLNKFDKPIIFQITLTPYKKDLEPNIIPKNLIIEGIKEISKIIGIENIYVRYDPIIINDIYSIVYHKKAFEKMCGLLDGYVNKIIVSFVDEYKNVLNNKKVLNHRSLSELEYQEIGQSFYAIASKHHMSVQTCYEEHNLVEYGFINDVCVSKQLIFKLTGKNFKKWNARKCNCVEMVDIGYYNSCKHFCKYCYANYDEKKVNSNFDKHNLHSSLLIGELEEDDIIKVRS